MAFARSCIWCGRYRSVVEFGGGRLMPSIDFTVAAGQATPLRWQLVARATLAAAGTKVPRRQQQGSSEIRPHQKGRGGSLAKKRAGALSFEQALMRPSPSRRHRAAGQFRDKPSRQLRKAAVLRACSKEPFCYAECIAELHRAAVHFSLPASALLQRSA